MTGARAGRSLGVAQIRDFTSLFQPVERERVVDALTACEVSDLRHEFTEDGAADFFLFSMSPKSARLAIGKGRGDFFLALARSGTLTETSRELDKILEKVAALNAPAA